MAISIALLITAIAAAATAGRPAETMLGRPWLTGVVCALLVICLMAQLNLPDLLSHMERDGSAIRAGQFYRLFTALWFQDGGIVGGLFNIVMLAVLGVIAEQVLSRAAWLCIYLIGGLLSEVTAIAWQPVGAGNSVAYMKSRRRAPWTCFLPAHIPRPGDHRGGWADRGASPLPKSGHSWSSRHDRLRAPAAGS